MDFFSDQVLVCVNRLRRPVWLSPGSCSIPARSPLSHAGVDVPGSALALFWIDKGRFYYVAEAYPMLLAMGAVSGERWLARVAEVGPSDQLDQCFFAGLVRVRGSLHLRAAGRSACAVGSAARLCAQAQRRSARRIRLG